MQKILENPKMSFNRQLNMFFGKIIFCTCDLHLKLDTLNPLKLFFYLIIEKMNPLPYNPFLQNFNILKFLYDLVFHQLHPMNMHFYRRGHVFVVQEIWSQLYDFMYFVWLLFKKMYFRYLITLVYKTQNDIYIVSKLLNFFLLI